MISTRTEKGAVGKQKEDKERCEGSRGKKERIKKTYKYLRKRENQRQKGYDIK